jgi:hypothetical protein
MKTKISITVMLFLFVHITAQDSLYLITMMVGEKSGDEFADVKKIGDVNGDGFDDVLVEASAEYANLYYGSSIFNTIADLRFTGDSFGSAGDVNGDGFQDILMMRHINGTQRKVCLFLGSSTMDTIPDFEFTGTISTETLGSAMNGVGDVNGDGFNDFIISSAYNWDDGKGRLYLFLGGHTLTTNPYFTFISDTIGDNFGGAVCGADFNEDGFNDIIVGATNWPNLQGSGRVVIYFGGTDIDNKKDIVLYEIDQDFGFDIHNAGDLDNNGIDDIIIGSGTAVYIYSRAVLTNIIRTVPNWGVGGNAMIGSGGDINNDSFNDFLIGNTNYINDNDVMVGLVRGYYGGTVLDTLFDFSMEGEIKWERFSYFLTIIGDINGDGYDEVAVGAPGYPDYQNPLGKVYVYSYKQPDGIDDPEYFNQKIQYSLYQNYPNPFNAVTSISYYLAMKSDVKLSIFDLLGQEVVVLIDQEQRLGKYDVIFKGESLNSGVYLYRLFSDEFTISKKMLLLK